MSKLTLRDPFAVVTIVALIAVVAIAIAANVPSGGSVSVIAAADGPNQASPFAERLSRGLFLAMVVAGGIGIIAAVIAVVRRVRNRA
jgi:hypothetical protein